VEKFGEYIKNEVLGDAITLNGNVSGESVEITEYPEFENSCIQKYNSVLDATRLLLSIFSCGEK
jgi:hypothetical protein